jgi:hypothetical protein
VRSSHRWLEAYERRTLKGGRLEEGLLLGCQVGGAEMSRRRIADGVKPVDGARKAAVHGGAAD